MTFVRHVARVVVALCLVCSAHATGTQSADSGGASGAMPAADQPADPGLAAYLDRIRNAMVVRYPTGREAALRCPKGVVKVWFSVARDGLLLDRGLVQSSGSILLDRSALAGLDRTRFPLLPADLVPTQRSKRFTLDIDFGAAVCQSPGVAPTMDPLLRARLSCDERADEERAAPRAFVKRGLPRLTEEARHTWSGGGTVRTRIAVDRDGSVVDVDVLDSPSPVLTTAVMEALASWQLAARPACETGTQSFGQTIVFDGTAAAQVRDE